VESSDVEIMVVYCAEVSCIPQLCQPDGGDDRHGHGHVEGEDAMTAHDPPRSITSAAPHTVARGAGDMQAQQRHALAGLLDIDAMLPPEQV